MVLDHEFQLLTLTPSKSGLSSKPASTLYQSLGSSVPCMDHEEASDYDAEFLSIMLGPISVLRLGSQISMMLGNTWMKNAFKIGPSFGICHSESSTVSSDLHCS